MENKKYFGVMLDMSRNAVMRPEEVKNFAKVIRSFGYNMIQLYMEDTYEVKGEPYFGYLRGRYSVEELRDMDAYCASIGVELVPCVQTLAHLGNIFRWIEYGGINDVNDILLVDEERTYKLIDNMFSSLASAFGTRLIHIGMDEAHMLGLGKFLDKHGAENRFDILLRHLRKVIEIANKYGFKPIMWSDMFFRLANRGEYYAEAGKKVTVPKEVIDVTPPEVGLVYWDYYHEKKAEYATMIKAHKQFKNDVWFGGGAWCWNGFASGNKMSIAYSKAAMQACRENGIDNIFLTMWGDNGKECSFYSLLPTLFAARKFYEGETDMRAIKTQFKELIGEDFDAMCALDIPNWVGGAKSIYYDICKHALYRDVFNGFLDSTNVDGVPAEYKRHAKRLAHLAKQSANYGYIFESEAALCDLLSVKYDLGVRVRAAYKAGDRDELAAVAADIKKAEAKVEKFYRAFKDLWYKENKPCGFDVQDQRLGGLKMRLRSCRERISDYLAGTIADIPELEEEILDWWCGTRDVKSPAGYNGWAFNVTANNM